MGGAEERVSGAVIVPDSSAYAPCVAYRAVESAGYDRERMAREGLFRPEHVGRDGEMAEYLAGELGAGRAVITETVHRETSSVVMQKILGQWSRRGGIEPDAAYRVRAAAARLLAEGRLALIPDSRRLLPEVRRAYDGFWTLPEFAADLARWKAANRRGKPPPGDADKTILSTAADLAARAPACLLTADMDFVAFAGPIREMFGVDVIDRWDPSRWPRWRGMARRGA